MLPSETPFIGTASNFRHLRICYMDSRRITAISSLEAGSFAHLAWVELLLSRADLKNIISEIKNNLHNHIRLLHVSCLD